MPSKIAHISYFLPEKVFSNEEYFKIFPELKENKNLSKIGVDERRVSSTNEIASDMSILAAKKLMSETNVSPGEIDFLIYSSLDLDFYTPATSMYIHKELGLSENCGAFDTTHGCSAYVYGLMMAKGMIESNNFKNVLLLNAYTLTKTLHPKDKACRYVFGDAATATLIVQSDVQKIGNCFVGTESKGYEKIILRDGGQRFPLNENSTKEISDEFGNTTSNVNLFMDGTGVFLFSLRRVPLVVKETLSKNNLSLDAIDLFIFHQANLYMIANIVKKVGIPEEKVFNNMQKIGNTVGCTIPIALAQAKEQGKIKEGNKVLVVGFGVGLSWSATVIHA